MDLATIGGFLLAMMMIALGAFLEHVTLTSMIGPSAFLIVVGGSVGATILSHTVESLKRVPAGLRLAFAPPRYDYAGMIDLLVSLAEKARRKGLLSLQEEAEEAEHPLVRRGLTMTVDGADPEVVHEVLESIADLQAEEMEEAAAVFETAGGYAPTIGILGTVMGLITVMRNLSEPDTLGPAIAVAFLATLYGVGFANLVFLPLGAKIKGAIKQQARFNEMIITGLIALQSGVTPLNLREKLSIYLPALPQRKRNEPEPVGAGEAAAEEA